MTGSEMVKKHCTIDNGKRLVWVVAFISLCAMLLAGSNSIKYKKLQQSIAITTMIQTGPPRISIDTDLEVITANTKASQLFKLTVKELLGRKITDFIPEECLVTKEFRAMVPSIVERDTVIPARHVHCIATNVDGVAVPVELEIVYIQDNNLPFYAIGLRRIK